MPQIEEHHGRAEKGREYDRENLEISIDNPLPAITSDEAAARQATGNMNKMMIGVSSLKIGRDGFKNNQRNKSCKDTPAVHGAVAANTT